MWTKLYHKSCTYVIGAIYSHPNQNISLLHDQLKNALDNLNKNKEIVYIVSDININFLKVNSSNLIKKYTDMIVSSRLCSCNNKSHTYH